MSAVRPHPASATVTAPELLRQLPISATETVEGRQTLATATDAADLAIERLLWLTGTFVALSIACLVALGVQVQRIFWSTSTRDADPSWRNYLMQLPLGAPEGSIRALMSIFVVVFGLLVLVMQNQLGLANVEAISGFVGIVITFYFTARSGDQSARAVGAAVQAAQAATAQVNTAVTQGQAQVDQAVAAVQQAAASVTHGAPPSPAHEPPDRGASSPAERSGLQQIRTDLATATQVIGALGGLAGNGHVAAEAETLAKAAGGVIDMIDPLLSGKPDAALVADAMSKAQTALSGLQAAGLPGVVGDAVAGLGGTLGALAPIVEGLAGGPVGLVGGIVMSGINLLEQRAKFDAWKAALLRAPFHRALMPATIDGTLAREALDPAVSPLMAAHLGPVTAAMATDLMREALRTDADGAPIAAETLAASLLTASAARDWSLAGKFGGVHELAEAIAQYRDGLAFAAARAQVQGSVDLPPMAGQPARRIDVGALVDVAAKLAVDGRAGADVERLVGVVEALGKLGLGPDRLAAVAEAALASGAALAQAGRERADARQTDPRL